MHNFTARQDIQRREGGLYRDAECDMQRRRQFWSFIGKLFLDHACSISSKLTRPQESSRKRLAVPFCLPTRIPMINQPIAGPALAEEGHKSQLQRVSTAKPLPTPPHVCLRQHLVLGGTGLGELEDDAAAGQLAVDLGVGVEAVVDAAALLLVEDDLEGLGAVLLGAEALADDLDGEDEVGEDGVVDGGQGAAAGALLLLGVARAGGALGAGQDAARGEDQDVAVRELLLELTGEAGGTGISCQLDGSLRIRG